MQKLFPVGKDAKGAAGLLLAALPAVGAVLTALAVTGDILTTPIQLVMLLIMKDDGIYAAWNRPRRARRDPLPGEVAPSRSARLHGRGSVSRPLHP